MTDECEGSFESVCEDAALSLDTLFSVVSNGRRRLVLSYLAEADRSVALADLSRAVARREHDYDETVPKTVVQDVYLSLYHKHVPKLADAGILTFDRESNVVAPTERGRQVTRTVERLRNQ